MDATSRPETNGTLSLLPAAFSIAAAQPSTIRSAIETLTGRVDSPATAARVQGAVRALGYRIAEERHRVTRVLVVEGMDCAEEKVRVEKALKDLPGLERLEVDLITERLKLVHDDNALPVGRVIAALFIDAWDEGAMVVFLFALAVRCAHSWDWCRQWRGYFVQARRSPLRLTISRP